MKQKIIFSSLLSILSLSIFLTPAVSANSTATTNVFIGILPGELTIEYPSIKSFGPKLNKDTYQVNISDLFIQDFQGFESDYKVSMNFEVYNKDGELKSDSILSADTVLTTDNKRHPDFNALEIISGGSSVIVDNNFKTWSGEYKFGFNKAKISGLDKDDTVVFTSERSFTP